MKKIILILFMAFLLTSCAGKEMLDDSKATKEMINEVSEANNKFAFDFFNQIDDDENLFFSPYSLSSAFSIVAEGAKGQTYDEMKSVFYLPDEDVRKNGNAGIYNLINKKNQKYKLSTANALWVKNDYLIKEEFLISGKDYYGAEIKNMNFLNAAASAREINNWIEDETNNKIKDVLSPSDLTAFTRLVISNAIYFKGKWEVEFEKSDTYEEEFHLSKDNTVNVDTMHLSGKDARFNYFLGEDFQMLELPYKDDEVSMIIILPESIENFSLDYDKFNSARFNYQNAILSLPKFKFETKYLLNSEFKEMGMPTAFNDTQADFSGIHEPKRPSEKLYISKVIHQAFIDVNEEGTEAAAATLILMADTAAAIPMEPIEFKVDKPFMFVIKHKESNEILFMGKVMDPREE
jgi:serpin B